MDVFDKVFNVCLPPGAGAAARGQLQELAMGGEVLVATPGRLIDFVDRGIITLARTRSACYLLSL